MPRYESYKDSGAEWLGEIPEHWRVMPIRALMEEKKHKNNSLAQNNYLSLLSNLGVIPYEQKGDIGNKKPEDLSKCKIVKKGDFLLNSMNFGIGSFGVSNYNGICSSVYLVLEAYKSISELYLRMLFEQNVFQKFAQSLGNGILSHRCSIGWDDLKNIALPLPNFEEQQAIARFLDQKTAQIDQAIAIKERQITLLKERKQILIQNTVTKGLNPDAPMKASGVDWIGDIPEHWEVKRLKYITTITKRIIGHEGPDVLSITQNGIKIKDIESGEGQLATDYSNYQVVEVGDFAMNHMDLVTGYVDISKYDGATSPDYRVFKNISPNLDDQYLLLLFQMGYKMKIFFKYGQGVHTLGRWRFPANAFNNFFIPIPPIKEQLEILETIYCENHKIDNYVSTHQTQIHKLQEYKATLINSLVTGKIKITQESPVKKPPNKAFTDAVIIAALVARFSDEKFQINRFRYTKFSYLLRRKLGHNVDNYQKKAAGPYDATIRYRGGEKLAINKRYIKQIKDYYKGFISDQNIDEAQKYFHSWFDKKSLDWLEQFRYKNNDELGLMTTIDKAMLEVRESSQPVTLQNIKQVLKSDNEWKNKLNQKIYSDNNIEITIKKLEGLFGAQ